MDSLNKHPHSNGLPPHDWTGDDSGISPVFTAMHRDPSGYLAFTRALGRLLTGAGEQPFTPCAGPCPVCQPEDWVDETC
jgi:hypothetical protein